MEPRFGQDFSGIRVHTDARAAESARTVNALAYTVGRDVVFGMGQYAPGTGEGRRLLAHELTHTIQQRDALQRRPKELAITQPHDRSEHEADNAANAIMNGEKFVSTCSDTAIIARLGDPDAGTPDAGTPDARTPGAGTPDAGTPDARTPGAGTPSTGTPGAGTVTPSPVVNSVEVENSSTSITYQVPSSAGATGRSHWVTVASLSGPEAVVRANLSPAVPASDPSATSLQWTVNGKPTVPSGDALHISIGRDTGQKVVRATLGGNSKELTIWAIFVNITSSRAVLDPAPAGAAPFRRGALINFTGTIIPAAITRGPDHPDLEGPNTVAPPGTVNTCREPLAGGVDHKWDMSRQIQKHRTDPAGIGARHCTWVDAVFPTNNAEGNDDANTNDENNNPYGGRGVITSRDHPRRAIRDGLGNNGDTLEFDLNFREFARLEYHGTWWRVSHFFPWRVTLRAIKVAGRWIDNRSTAAP